MVKITKENYEEHLRLYPQEIRKDHETGDLLRPHIVNTLEDVELSGHHDLSAEYREKYRSEGVDL